MKAKNLEDIKAELDPELGPYLIELIHSDLVGGKLGRDVDISKLPSRLQLLIHVVQQHRQMNTPQGRLVLSHFTDQQVYDVSMAIVKEAVPEQVERIGVLLPEDVESLMKTELSSQMFLDHVFSEIQERAGSKLPHLDDVQLDTEYLLGQGYSSPEMYDEVERLMNFDGDGLEKIMKGMLFGKDRSFTLLSSRKMKMVVGAAHERNVDIFKSAEHEKIFQKILAFRERIEDIKRLLPIEDVWDALRQDIAEDITRFSEFYKDGFKGASQDVIEDVQSGHPADGLIKLRKQLIEQSATLQDCINDVLEGAKEDSNAKDFDINVCNLSASWDMANNLMDRFPDNKEVRRFYDFESILRRGFEGSLGGGVWHNGIVQEYIDVRLGVYKALSKIETGESAEKYKAEHDDLAAHFELQRKIQWVQKPLIEAFKSAGGDMSWNPKYRPEIAYNKATESNASPEVKEIAALLKDFYLGLKDADLQSNKFPFRPSQLEYVGCGMQKALPFSAILDWAKEQGIATDSTHDPIPDEAVDVSRSKVLSLMLVDRAVKNDSKEPVNELEEMLEWTDALAAHTKGNMTAEHIKAWGDTPWGTMQESESDSISRVYANKIAQEYGELMEGINVNDSPLVDELVDRAMEALPISNIEPRFNNDVLFNMREFESVSDDIQVQSMLAALATAQEKVGRFAQKELGLSNAIIESCNFVEDFDPEMPKEIAARVNKGLGLERLEEQEDLSFDSLTQ